MRKILGLVVLALVAGCSDSGTGPNLSHVGSYALETANGDPLPAVLVQVGADKIEITGGTVRLNDDNTFTDRVTLRTTEGGVVSTDEAIVQGTYSINANAVQLTTTDGSRYSMSRSGGTLTQTLDGLVLVYRR